MKIRIRGNSVRIRLSKSEVEQFAEDGFLEEKTDFISSTLSYSVKKTDSETMSADFVNGSIILYVPGHLIRQWASTNLVGLDCDMPVNNGKHLHILLEKDFKCIDNGIKEDQSDYFENPAKSC